MKERHLIVLRPNQYNNGDLKLGLFTEDYLSFVRGRNVHALYVKFYAANRKIPSIKTYINHGSIEKKSIISNWLKLKKFSEGELLLFELIMDNDAGIHFYNFLGASNDVKAIIDTAANRIR